NDILRKGWEVRLVCLYARSGFPYRRAGTRQNRMMKPAGVHHVAICVADAQKGLAFYRDVLGMTQLPRPDLGPGYWLDAGGPQGDLMECDTQQPGATHFAIRVDDIDAAVTDLQEQGVEVHRTPFIPGAGHQAFLHDPFGNLLELNQPGIASPNR